MPFSVVTSSVRTLLFLMFLLLSFLQNHAQDWVWLKGASVANQNGVFGPSGIATSSANPSSRQESAYWTDASGNFWIMGGYGLYNNSSAYGNDLWKYDAGANQWTWIRGNGGTTADPVVYGVQGVPSPSNNPGARTGPSTWRDNSGNLWMFGGFGSGTSWTGELNDLWKYNIATNQWTWISGSVNAQQYGTYGFQGIPSVSNTPGARKGALCWTDNSGNFWLFGGEGYAASTFGVLSDLWKFNPLTNEWTWYKGSSASYQTAYYGTLGVPAANNQPGGRTRSGTWTDAAGNLWLFGGIGNCASPGTGLFLNDIWKYNIGSQQWTWMKGNSVNPQPATYGIQNTPAALNCPGSREVGMSWTDVNGNFWVYGGKGCTTYTIYNNVYNFLDDLWKYDMVSNQWTWVKGSTLFNQPGVYGSQGIASPSVNPGPHWEAMGFRSNTGDFYLFGGWGYDGVGTAGRLDNLWRFNVCSTPAAPVSVSSTSNLITCNGSSVQLSAVGTGTLNWFASPLSTVVLGSGNTFTATGLSTGTQTFYTSANCTNASSLTPIVVTVTPGPTISVNTGSICAGNSFVINPTGANSFSINGGSFTVSPLVTYNYTVSGTSTAGCVSNPVIVTLTVLALPSLTVSMSSPTICVGDLISFSVTGASSYSWSTGSNATSFTASPATNTSYAVSGTGTNGCIAVLPASVQVSVFPIPVVNVAASNNTVCAGDTIVLTASGANAYTWNNSSNSYSFAITPTTTSTYSVTGTSSAGCNMLATKQITVFAKPVLIISGLDTLCYGSSAALSSSGAATYTWSTLSNSTNIVVTPSTSTVYSLTGTNAAGCTAMITKLITINPVPTITIVGPDSCCQGSQVTFYSNGAASYSWSTQTNDSSWVTVPNSSITFTVQGSFLNGCSSSAIKNLLVRLSPTVSVVGPDSTCYGSTVIFQASGATNYIWGSGPTTSSVAFSPSLTITQTVTGTDQFGCSAQKTKLITVLALPNVGIGGSNTVCANSSLVLAGTGAATYTWNNGVINNQPFIPQTDTNYVVKGTDQFGCENSDTIFIQIVSLPPVQVSSSKSIACTGDEIVLSATGANSYLWTTGAQTASISVAPTQSITYTVAGVNANGCYLEVAFTQTIVDCLGLISEGKVTDVFEIFPNPGNGLFTLRCGVQTENRRVVISSIDGRIISHLELNGEITTLDLLMLEQGIYILRVLEEGKTLYTQKLIKN